MESLIMQADLECKIELDKINHLCESAISNFDILCMESTQDVITESVSDVVKKISGAIRQMVLSTGTMLKKVVKGFSEKLKGVFAKVKLNSKTAKAYSKVDVYQCEKDIAALNEYIRAMAKLERELMMTEFAMVKAKGSAKQMYSTGISKIYSEMAKLDMKYDKVVESNKSVIRLALDDAIRFSDKQINDIELNLGAVKDHSEKVLSIFEKDIKDCDHPKKMSAIQKMSSSISTRVRKMIKRYSTFACRTCSTIGTVLKDAAIFAAAATLPTVVDEFKHYGTARMNATSAGHKPPSPKEYAKVRGPEFLDETKDKIVDKAKKSPAYAAIKQAKAQVDAAKADLEKEIEAAKREAEERAAEAQKKENKGDAK